MPRKFSDFVIFEDSLGPVTPVRKPRKTKEAVSKDDLYITALKNYIKDLHEQLTISNNDLTRLHEFINQPLLDKQILQGTTAETAYKAARQKIAIRYATNELKSIYDVVVHIGTQISNADLKLVHLKSSLEHVSQPSVRWGVFGRLSEMLLGLWDHYETVLEFANVCEFALEHETVVAV